MKFLSHSPSETIRIASQWVKDLKKEMGIKNQGVVVGLQGDLGAGKTTFVRGMAAGLGLDPQDVTSPTFTLINEYGSLIHVDLYRLEKKGEAELLALEEYLAPGRILVIEWPERFPELQKQMTVIVYLKFSSEQERDIEVTPWPMSLKISGI